MPHLHDLPQLLNELRERNLYRDPDASGAVTGLVDFSANDTLGLARGGVSRETSLGSGAARAVFGSHPAHLTTERYLSEWLQREGALLFSSGYSANVGALSALLSPDDLVLSDALNHASLIDGIRLSRAQVHVFPHLELEEAANWARSNPPRGAVWLVLESYYSMDGDSPDLVRARQLCDAHGWNLYLDEAHAFGLFGPEGRGLAAASGVTPDVLMVGFGKAIGTAGAALVGSTTLRQWLWNKARAFVFSTAPSPHGTALLQSQLELARRSETERARVQKASHDLRLELIAEGWSMVPGSHGPIVGLLLGDGAVAQALTVELELRGVRAQAIRPPTVPPGTSRIRLIISARHAPEELARLRSALRELAPRFALREPVSSLMTATAAPTPPGPRPRRILVLGTGTGIGKTYLAARLVELLSAAGARVLGLKPVESGLGETPPGETDWETLGRPGLLAIPPRYGFAEPLSPHLCAARLGQHVSLSEIGLWLEQLEREHQPNLIVLETAGGVFSPLSHEHSNAHSLATFKPDAVLLVAPDRLGVLHEVQATLRALHQLQGEARGTLDGPLRVPVDGVVLSVPALPDASTGLNGVELSEIVLSKFRTLHGSNLELKTVARSGTLEPRDWAWLSAPQ